MYAVIAHGGKQYRVAPGDVVRFERVPDAAGATVEFTRLLLIESEGALRLGSGLVGAKVVGTVVKHNRGPRITVFKKKRCKQYRRTSGHRQNHSEIRIDRIV